MTKLGSDSFSEITDTEANIQQNTKDISELQAEEARLNPSTLAIWKADPLAAAGNVVTTKERTAGKGGGATGDVIAGTGTANGLNIVAHDTLSVSWDLRLGDEISALAFGVPSDGSDGLAAITAALATGIPVKLDANNTFNVSDEILIESFRTLKLGANTTLIGATSPAVRVKGQRGGLEGVNFSSVIKLAASTPSPQGIIKIGHKLITDPDEIQYNEIKNLRLLGDDPFGTKGIHAGIDTIGLMCLNLGDWDRNPSANGFVFFNQVHNILFEDVKQAYVLASSVNAQISSKLYFRRIGEFGIHCFVPQTTDAVGTVFGVDWNDVQRLDSSLAENSFDQMFVDGSFQDTTGIFPIMAFIRLTFNTETQQFTNIMDESGPNTVMTVAEGYNIDVSVRDCHLHGNFNIAPAGTNGSVSTSIWDLAGVSRQRELRIDLLFSDKLQAQLTGSTAAPWLFHVGSESTGVYWPVADEMAFSDTGVERYRLGGSTPHVFTGNLFVNGDTTLKTTTPLDDNNRNLGSLSLRWKEIFSANGTINTSDEREKTPITSISAKEKAVALELKSKYGKFKWLESVEREDAGGNKARIHFGIGAQTVKATFEKHGLVAEDYAVFCYEAWDEIPAKTRNDISPEGAVIVTEIAPAVPAGDRYGIRLEQLNAFIISAM